MDKWKDIELEKMKIGGNRKARIFFESQPDWEDTMSIQQKYNTKAAALYRDKVSIFSITISLLLSENQVNLQLNLKFAYTRYNEANLKVALCC